MYRKGMFDMTHNKPPGHVDGVDGYVLTNELTALRMVLSSRAATREQYLALGHVVAAEKAAERGDVISAMSYLRTAGNWVWEIADIVGFGMTRSMIESALEAHPRYSLADDSRRVS